MPASRRVKAAKISATPWKMATPLEGRADILRLPRVDADLDLELLLKALSERGVRAILLEGGPTLAGSFLAAGLIDQVVAYIAPVLIGGGVGQCWLGPAPSTSRTPGASNLTTWCASAPTCVWPQRH